MKVPTEKNDKLQKVLDLVNSHVELQTLWDIINTNAMTRLGITDHGPVHFQIVANVALRLLRILHHNGIQTSIEKDYELSYDDAEVVVFFGSIMHDLGMSIQRQGHEEMSLFIANRLLHEMLPSVYDVRTRTIIVSETLHTIIAHRSGGEPRTLEAGIVRVADALDMAEGRSRIAFDAGYVNIHSVSALAIKDVKIETGTIKPIHIEVHLDNSAGIFQVDELFNNKIKGSGLEQYMTLTAINKSPKEKQIVAKYEIV